MENRAKYPQHNELLALDAIGQVKIIRRAEVRAIELIEASIEQIERLNPHVSTVITPLFEKAPVQAESAVMLLGPFHGVPILLKDLFCETRGEPYYAGMRFLLDLNWRSQQDTYLVAKFRDAEFIVLGKTNLPELAGGVVTKPEAFGPTRNPWNVDCSPAGSSGGCDAAAILDAVAGAMPGDRYFAPPPSRPYREEVGTTCPPMRIGLLVEHPFFSLQLHANITEAVERTGRLLESLGHHVEYAYPQQLAGATGLGLALRIVSASVTAAANAGDPRASHKPDVPTAC